VRSTGARGGGRVPRFFKGWDPLGKGKGFTSSISKIKDDTFNTGQSRFAAQFTQSRKNIGNFLQPMASDKGYLVAKTVQMGKEQTIALPAPIDQNAVDAADQKIIHNEAVRAIANCKAKLDDALKKGYAMVWDQCLQEVQEKLESSKDWE
jgi:hypothetical protein